MSTLIVIIVSVLSSGAFAAIISFSFSEAKERWLLRRAKIEEIYLSAATWLQFVGGDFLYPLRVCKGTITYDQMLDMQLEKNKDRARTLGELHLKMKMNVYMYERSLVPEFELMESELNKANTIVFSIKRRWEQTGQASELFEPLNRQLKSFEAASDALKTAIILRGVAIGSEKGLLDQAYTSVRATLAESTKRLVAQLSSVRSVRFPRRR